MSAGIMEREYGDDRDPEVLLQRLQEMYNQPEAPEPTYASEKPGVAVGEFAPVPLGRERGNYPTHLGRIATRRVHIRPSTIPPDNFKG